MPTTRTTTRKLTQKPVDGFGTYQSRVRVAPAKPKPNLQIIGKYHKKQSLWTRIWQALKQIFT